MKCAVKVLAVAMVVAAPKVPVWTSVKVVVKPIALLRRISPPLIGWGVVFRGRETPLH